MHAGVHASNQSILGRAAKSPLRVLPVFDQMQHPVRSDVPDGLLRA